MMHKTNSTALDMEILGSKSNGIVTWGNTSDAGCEDTFSKDILVAPSDGECSLGSALSCLLHRQAHLCPGLRCVTSKSRSDWWSQPHQLSAKTPPFSFLSIREPHPGRSQNILDKEQRGKNVSARALKLTLPEPHPLPLLSPSLLLEAPVCFSQIPPFTPPSRPRASQLLTSFTHSLSNC